MKQMSPLEQKIYNEGERLIPGISHTLAEVIRHRSSYLFFRRVIELDMIPKTPSKPIRIVDLGCGVGHGCATLAELPNTEVVGVDVSSESIAYAQAHYRQSNIRYQVADLCEYVAQMPEFDYVVSRNVFEHIPDGLQVAYKSRWRKRLLFDVPYAELPGRNPYHMLSDIREKDFAFLGPTELFYQDLEGKIYDIDHKPPVPNVIACICSNPDLVKVMQSSISFPISSWQPHYTFGQRIVGKLRQIQQAWRN